MQRLEAIGNWVVPPIFFQICAVIGVVLAFGAAVGADTDAFATLSISITLLGALGAVDKLKAWATPRGANYASFLVLLGMSTTLVTLPMGVLWLFTA